MSGAGKSAAAQIFAEHGFCAINCDKEARKTIAHPLCAEAVKSVFPEAYTGGEFDKIKMARLVFSDSEKLKRYEKIVFPYITYYIINYILRQAEKGVRNFLLDAPALFQSGADDLCGEIIAITADKKTCARRITERDAISEADAFLRLNSQPGANFYRERAAHFIENDSGFESFRKKVAEVIKKTGKK